jgi:hypothetical protein
MFEVVEVAGNMPRFWAAATDAEQRHSARIVVERQLWINSFRSNVAWFIKILAIKVT